MSEPLLTPEREPKPYAMEAWVDKINEHARQAGLANAIDDTIKTVTDRERKAVKDARSYLLSRAFSDAADVAGLTICKAHIDWERVVLVFNDGYYLCIEHDGEGAGTRPVSLDTHAASELGLLPKHLQTEIQAACTDKNAKLRKLKAQQTLKTAIATLGIDEVKKVIDDA